MLPEVYTGAVRAHASMVSTPDLAHGAPDAPFHTVLHRAVSERESVAPVKAHRVAPGEHLSGIVKEQLEARGITATHSAIAQGVRQVARDNGLSNPDLIHPGQKLMVRTAAGERMPTASPVRVLMADTPRAARQIRSRHSDDRDAAPWSGARATLVTSQNRALGNAYPLSAQVPADVVARAAVNEHLRDAGLSRLRAQGGVSVEGLSALAMRVGAWQPPDIAQRAVDMYESVSGIVRRARNTMSATGIQEMSPPASAERPWAKLLDGPGAVTSNFGMRADPFTGQQAFHQGIDIAAAHGTGIRPVAPGRVVYSGWLPGYGKTVIVEHDSRTESVYAHCSHLHARKGDPVTPQTVLAEVGSTGRSTGNHLHFEMRRNGRPVNPLPFIRP